MHELRSQAASSAAREGLRLNPIAAAVLGSGAPKIVLLIPAS